MTSFIQSQDYSGDTNGGSSRAVCEGDLILFQPISFVVERLTSLFWRSVRGLPQQAVIQATSSGKHFSRLNLPMKTGRSSKPFLPFVYDIGIHMVLVLLPVISIVDYFREER